MADIREQPKFRIQDNPSIVETYANKFLGSVFDGGAVSLTFGTIRVVVEKQVEGSQQETVIQVTHRLTLSRPLLPNGRKRRSISAGSCLPQSRQNRNRCRRRLGVMTATPRPRPYSRPGSCAAGTN
jgi:hypothetical protein